ncbi:MAG: hypothetical protein LBF15_06290 [Candidatus Peribacteria bacterium]|jgi:hypothetical protein|nr:hypothetical protein [Candidatus Peribacteria bacterium]
MCRLEDMMPPTIGFGDGTCGSPTLSFISDEEKERFSICNSEYANREGINDCLEDILANPRNEQETEIGTSRLFLGSNIFNNNEGFTFSSASSVMASSSANIFLMNASVDRESITNSLRGASIASEKLVFSFGNLARDGTFLALAYPLTINLYDDV